MPVNRNTWNSRLRLIFCPRVHSNNLNSTLSLLSSGPIILCLYFIYWFLMYGPPHFQLFVSPLMESNANLRDVYFSHIGEGVSVGWRDSPVPGPGSGPSDRCNFNFQVRYRNGPSSMCKYRLPGAYLGFCQGGCTFLADLPPPPRIRIWIWIRIRIRIKTTRIHSPGLNCQKIVV